MAIKLFHIFTLIVALVWLIRLIYLVGKRQWFSAAFLAFALVWSLNALVALSLLQTSTVNAAGVVRNPRVELLYVLGLLLLPLIARRTIAAVLIAHRLMLFLSLWWGYRFVVDGFARIGDHTITLGLILVGHVMLTVVVHKPLSKRRKLDAQERQEALEATFE